MYVSMHVYIRVNVNVNMSIIWNAGMQCVPSPMPYHSLTGKPIDFIRI